MNETLQKYGWSIEFNFPIPKKYRKTFILKDGDCTMLLTVRGRVVGYRSAGGMGDANFSKHLDWIEECMEQVRSEFGQ